MSTEEALVAVTIGAIAANLLLAVGLIVGPRWRARRWSDRARAAGSRTGAAAANGGPRERPVRIGSGADGVPTPLPAVTRRPPIAGRAPGGDLLARLEAARTGAVREAAIDPATGLDVASTWSRWLAEEGARAERYGRPSTIVVVELAGWERLAERLGDDAAERLVPPVAATMRGNARAADRLARLGPARFGALLAETDEIRAINYVERIRSACDVWLAAGAVALRLSIGWAEIGPHQPVDAAILAADRRLNAERRGSTAASSADSTEPDVTAAMLV
jgi:diguanylate cyclase (GGDEF)-like protein